jgi:glycosyltransferase involved in cell wall biosynthesis
MDISVVIPVFNERDNVQPLYQELRQVLEGAGRRYELIFVDDGSTDGSRERLETLAQADPRVRVVLFRRNYGQTAALQAGIDWSSGRIVVTLDGDLQNDPADIPVMLAKLEEGYDLVHGWRQKRQDAWHRRLPSRLANWLIARVTGVPVHDLGCTLKVIRREVAEELELYGEMHRFIAVLAEQRGARFVEVVTHHRPRKFGTTKYGLSRTLRVLLDLLTVKYLLDYFASPMKMFGAAGLASLALGGLCGLAVTAMKIGGGVDMTGNPLLLLTVFSWMASLQFFSMGLLGEVAARIYFGTEGRRNYAVRRVLNDVPRTTAARRAA